MNGKQCNSSLRPPQMAVATGHVTLFGCRTGGDLGHFSMLGWHCLSCLLTWLIIISDDGKLTHKYKWTHFLSTQVTKHEPMGPDVMTPESARFSLQWIWLMNSVVSGAFGGAGVLHMGHISTCKVISWSATCNLSLLQNIRTSPWRYQMHLQIFRLWDGPQDCRRQ